MPCTTVQKMIGAISIRIALMKASPSGCILAPASGLTIPSAMPAAMAMSTWIQSSFHQARPRGLSIASAVIGRTRTGAPGLSTRIFLLEFRLRREQRDQVDEVAVIRHHLDVGMRPVACPR